MSGHVSEMWSSHLYSPGLCWMYNGWRVQSSNLLVWQIGFKQARINKCPIHWEVALVINMSYYHSRVQMRSRLYIEPIQIYVCSGVIKVHIFYKIFTDTINESLYMLEACPTVNDVQHVVLCWPGLKALNHQRWGLVAGCPQTCTCCLLHETYSYRSKRNQVVSREILTKRRYVLETTRDTRV